MLNMQDWRASPDLWSFRNRWFYCHSVGTCGSCSHEPACSLGDKIISVVLRLGLNSPRCVWTR